MYVVMRNGIYQQGIVGVFDSKGKASTAVINAKAKEPDDYHTFEIKTIIANKEYDPDETNRGY